MHLDIVEGAIDKSEAGLRQVLSAQAKLRVLVAAPVVVIEALLYLTAPNMVAMRLLALTAAYCTYIVGLGLATTRFPGITARELLLATAILDPIALTAWLMVTGEYGSLIVAFYLFTTLGFGFRTGRPLMHLCQITSIAGFLLTLLTVPYWQEHVTVWLALMVPLIVVPMYSGALVKTLRDSREHAQRESMAKSDLLAKVSHELRTPLTGIISSAELLASEGTQAQTVKRADTILTLSNELLREINGLLDECKYGARAAEIAPAAVDLGRQLELVQDALGTTALKKGVELSVAVDARINTKVMVDGHHLGRVLLNLAGNSVKFTERGYVRVSVEYLHGNVHSMRARFCVTDTGIGIPDSFRTSIFSPFAQVDQGPGRRYGGTGLGLALSHKIVELMGGTLQFESTLGKGSRFWFDLDLERASEAHVDLALATEEGLIAETRVAPRRILVAEDNETNLMLLRELLEVDGHEVLTCANGIEALEKLAETQVDLLLLDYNLGDMDGIRVLQTYRFGTSKPAPALFLTADTTQATARRLHEAVPGAGVLYKPIKLASLRHAIAALDSGFEQDMPDVAVPSPGRAARPVLTAVAVSPLDLNVIEELRSVSHRPEFFPTLLAEAEADLRRNGELVLQALGENSYSNLRDAAHALKGVSANIGAVRLFALTSRLMAAARDEIEAESEQWIKDLGNELRIAIDALDREIRAPGASGSVSGSS